METVEEASVSHSKEPEMLPMTSIREGKAEIWVPKTGTSNVFYNPVQEFNRDLSSAALKTYIDNISYWKPRKHKDKPTESQTAESKISVLEGLSATGLRAVRYALEVQGIDTIVANDISKEAFQRIQNNIVANKVDNIVTAKNQDASLLMYHHRYPTSKRFTVIDIDPYGSAVPFLDASVQAIDDGGLLMVTCTDMGVLCGNHSDACYGKYGSMSIKAKFCHEMALRILLSSIESHANRYKRYIVPLVCISIDFYVRIFVQVFTSPSEVKKSPSKQSYVYHCVGCGSFYFQQVGRCLEEGSSKKYPPGIGPCVGMNCEQCGGKFHVGGPIWTESMHNDKFCKDVREMVQANKDHYNTSQRIIGVLTMAEEELPDTPLYYTLNHLSNVLHCNTPSIIQFRSALLSLGYSVSGTHACSTAVKTNAPNSVIWDVMRCWVKLHPVKRKPSGSPGTIILDKVPEIQAVFDTHADANPLSRKQGLLRFQPNPETNWGPQTRAKRNTTDETQAEKRQRLQGKRKHTDKEQASLKNISCQKLAKGDSGDSFQYSLGETTTKEDANEQTSTASTSKAAEAEQEGDDGKTSHLRRHRSVEFQRSHSVTEAEHSLLF